MIMKGCIYYDSFKTVLLVQKLVITRIVLENCLRWRNNVLYYNADDIVYNKSLSERRKIIYGNGAEWVLATTRLIRLAFQIKEYNVRPP